MNSEQWIFGFEVGFLLSVGLVSFAIVRRARMFGGLRDCIVKFVEGKADSKPILLMILIVPKFVVGVLAVLVLLERIPPNALLILISILVAENFILALYFLNGRLVMETRAILRRGVHLWNRFGIFRVSL